MKTNLWLATILIGLLFDAAVSCGEETPVVFHDPAVGRKVPAFTATTLDVTADPPKQVDLDSSKVKKNTAYIFVGTTCPATNAYAERFSKLAATYKAKGVDFVYFYPNRDDTPEAQIKFHKDRQLGGRLVSDQGARIAQLFDAKRTTEIFLTNADGKVVYHGPVDDARDVANVKHHFLTDAMDELLAKKPITVATSTVFA